MKLVGWKEIFLSKAGKEILLKIVVQVLQQYAMSIFKSPYLFAEPLKEK